MKSGFVTQCRLLNIYRDRGVRLCTGVIGSEAVAGTAAGAAVAAGTVAGAAAAVGTVAGAPAGAAAGAGRPFPAVS
jgi:hypothetical protein